MKKIKELLEASERDTGIDENYDKLAQKIFLTEKRPEQLLEYYLPAGRAAMRGMWDTFTSGLARNIVMKMSDYECRLLDKLLLPSKTAPIVCVVGGIGTGKSMTLQLLSRAFNEYVHCSRGHNGRNICYVDLNRCTRLKQVEELYNIMNSAIQVALYKAAPELQKMEYEICEYWPKLIKEEDVTNFAIRGALIEELRVAGLQEFRDVANGLSEYKSIYVKLKSNREWYFQYLLLYWRHIMRQIYGNDNMMCCLFIIDNVDWQPPPIQEEIVSMILPYAKLSGTPFLMATRPAFYQHYQVGVWVTDVESHEGPKPYDVILDCIEKYLISPRSYLANANYDMLDEGKGITEKIKELKRVLTEDGVLEPFINNIFGNNIRAALSCVQTIVSIRHDEGGKEENRLSPHALNRTLVRRGEQYYEYTYGNPDIENIFYVEGKNDEYLCKPRILHYIKGSGRENVEIGNIVGHLKNFDYTDAMIAKALTQLSMPKRQLIMPSHVNAFSEGDVAKRIGGTISLSPMGLGYIRHIMYDSDYISEVIMDCTIDEEQFVLLETRGIRGRFDALRGFMKALYGLEYREIIVFQGNREEDKREYGANTYSYYYGNSTISFLIGEKVIQSMYAIFRSIINEAVKANEKDVGGIRIALKRILEGMYSDHLLNQSELKDVMDKAPTTGITRESLEL